jgi:HAD superfamily hydrolase (TIGR01509 family)
MKTAPPSPNPWPGPGRAVVFDLDGTLIDTEGAFAEAARRLLADRGMTLEPEFMASIMGVPGRDALPRFRDRYRLTDSLDVIADAYKRHFIEVLRGIDALLMPGARELLDRLEECGVPRAIATSSGREYVEYVFAPLGLLGHFAFVLTADDVRQGKPAPEVYETAAARFGLAPADLVVLEDSLNGVRAAKAAGARVVMVPHAHTPAADRTEADAVVPSLAARELWAMLGVGGAQAPVQSDRFGRRES